MSGRGRAGGAKRLDRFSGICRAHVALSLHICHAASGPKAGFGDGRIATNPPMRERYVRAENPAKWLIELSDADAESSADGLVLVKGFRALDLPPEQYAIMEKAESYEAHSVFFEAGRNDRSPVAQAFIYVSDHPGESQDFAVLHKRLWSWGGVPLLYRKTPGKVELFRCASKADFDQSTEVPKYNAYDTISIAANISSAEFSTAAWWDFRRLRNGTLWDDPAVCEHLLSDTASAHRQLVDN